jgi:phosphohistidine phosphatase SixA
MLVGHLPFLARLAARLLAGEGVPIPRFVNAEIVRLSSRHGTWSLDWTMSPDRL